MDRKEQNFNVYLEKARPLAEKFDRIGAQLEDIREVFSLMPKKNPATLELGCGNGRDAKEILKHTNNYLGIDFSPSMIELAQKANPEGNFKVGDLEDAEFPKNLDIVFAYASLIHSPREVQEKTFKNIQQALNAQGLFSFTVKTYDKPEVLQTDEFGTRIYYSYSTTDIQDMARDLFNVIKLESRNISGQDWVEGILQKP